MKLAMGESLSARELLFLQAMSEAEMLGTSKGLSASANSSWGLWKLGGDRWDWSSPGQAEWEALSVEDRRLWVPDNRREVPERGDLLLLIDGQPVPRGEFGEMGEEYDHSSAYALLEQAGLHEVAPELTAEPSTDDELLGLSGPKMLRRLMTLWMQTISKPIASGSSETVRIEPSDHVHEPRCLCDLMCLHRKFEI